MNGRLNSAAELIETMFKASVSSYFLQFQKELPEKFSKEAIIKLTIENDFDDEKTTKALLDLFVATLYNEAFK